MFILITYDVNTSTAQGRKRLRKVSKECVNYGQRVQNSVYECEIDNAKWLKVKHILLSIIDEENDSIRFYYFGDRKKSRVENYGTKPSLNVTEPIVL
ncbi:MAG: CRISPR-associated endonuclease Cas2 [Lachnospiraceae bacterium]|nr:CRISPR-associated endonuclease Cas2 [Lachnospiraceae bacterium]